MSEVLGLYFRCRSWSRSNYWSCFALTETVGNTQAQHAVVRRVPMVCASPMLLVHWYSRRSDFGSDRILNTASEDRRNAGVVVFKGCATRYVSLGVCIAIPCTTQTSVDVQIVSDWVTQFSGQLNALSFVCAVDVVAFTAYDLTSRNPFQSQHTG